MIEAATVKISTMADDTLRIVLDISPQHAQEAFALFGVRGSPVVIARLTQEAATATARAEQVAGHTSDRVVEEKPKGGDLARLAGQFCANPRFREWLYEIGYDRDVTADEAAEAIRVTCDINSRAELDHRSDAAEAFHESIRRPFAEWCRARGVAA